MIGWVDASVGASGDMLLGAFVGAGADLAVVQAAVDRLEVGAVSLRVEPVRRATLAATRVHVELPAADPALDRSWADIRALLSAASLEPRIADLAQAVFGRLARAEGRVHGVPADDVHFHEVGALDSLADVVGVCAAYVDLGSPWLTCSPVAVGSGWVATRHGRMSVPVPATVEVLTEAGAPVKAGPLAHEACTPTGAALLSELATGYGPLPAMTVARTGVGAGGRDPTGAANVTRLVLGEPTSSVLAPSIDRGPVVLEANVDDQDPRLWPVVLDRLFGAGASDAWLTPILMKKGRPAYTLHALCPRAAVDAVAAEIFRSTTTIGLRRVEVGKVALERETRSVVLDGQVIAVKIAVLDGAPVNVSVEFDDAVAAAERLGRPLKQVIAEATALAAPSYRD